MQTESDSINSNPPRPVSDPHSLTYREAGVRLGVSVVTLRRWIAAGRLQVRRYSPTCARIPLEEIERLEREALV